MRNKFIVLAPYELNLLNAIMDSIFLNLGQFLIVGDKKRLMLLCLKYNLNFQLLNIYDEVGDINICIKAQQLIEKDSINYIIAGNVNKDIALKILKSNNNKPLSNFYLFNFSEYKWVFGLCYLNERLDFESKGNTIKEARELLNGLGVETDEVAIIYDQEDVSVSQTIELTKMYLIQKLNFEAKIYTHYKISDLLDLNKNINYFKNIRLIFTTNYSLIEALKYSHYKIDLKTTQIVLSNKRKMIMIGNENSDDILFTLFLLNKLSKENKYINVI